MSGDSSIPAHLAEAVTRVSIHCRRCGYNLRGLPAGGRCPECGQDIWLSVLHLVDPAASRLPKLRNPLAVGAGLVWLMSWAFFAAVLIAVRYVSERLGEVHPTGFGFPTLFASEWMYLAAAGSAILSLWGVWRIARPRAEPPGARVHRDLQLIAVGLIGWSVAVAVKGVLIAIDQLEPASITALLALAGDLGAAVSLMGIRGVFQVIGLRSRAYRTSRGGQQGASSMIAAVGGDAIGRVLQLVLGSLGGEGRLALLSVGDVLVAISNLMLLIGLAYLVMNASWIYRSLRQPPPALEDVLHIAEGAEQPQPSSE